MGQINTGRVRVVNGSSIVQAMYNLNLGAITGTSSLLVPGAEVQWGPSGADEGRGIISENSNGNIWLYRKLRQGSDGITAASSTTFLSGEGNFTSADATKAITISGAGADGADLETTISSVTNGYTVVLANAATTAGTGMTWSMLKGAVPEVNERLAVVGATGTYANIDQIAAGSPPNWNTSLQGVTGAPIFSIRDNASAAVTVATNASGPVATSDTVTLTEPWGSDTIANVEYGITFDFTPNLALPLLQYGDVDSPALISRAFQELDLAYAAQVKFSGALIQANAAQTLSSGNAWITVTVLDTASHDEGGWVAASGDSFFTVPAGITRVRMTGSVELTTTASSPPYAEEAARIVKDVGGTPTEFAGSTSTVSMRGEGIDVTPPHVIACATSVIPVSAGDKFLLQVFMEGAGATVTRTVANSVRSWFAIEAVTFS